MSSAQGKFGIDLLSKTEFERSFWGRFLEWALTTGRYIVILTELVVIAAFLSRFKLDKDYADLGDRITGKKAVLAAMANTESNFRLTQERLATARKIIDNQFKATAAIDRIMEKLPLGTEIVGLTVSAQEVMAEARAESDTMIGEVISRLAQEPTWKEVELVNVTGDKQQGIRFSLRLTL